MATGIGAFASGRMVGFGALIAIGVLPATSAGAQTPEQRNLCSSSNYSPDQKIAACTAVIQSGRYSHKNLAIVGHAHSGDK